MSLGDPVIITCAISGVLVNREQCPAIACTPQDYAAEARRLVDEGVAMIHIHARGPDGTPSHEVEDFAAIVAELGGSIRVGLEDNLYLPDGTMARSDGELVARARRMTVDAGRRPAGVAEARAMLGTPRR